MRRILNNAISLIVVVIVLFLVIPLHPSVLDVLLILNISLAGIKCVLHPSDPQERGKRRCGH